MLHYLVPDKKRERPRPGAGIPRYQLMLELSQEEIDRLNAFRNPSDRIDTTAVCGARLSMDTLTRRLSEDPLNKLPSTCTHKAGWGTTHPGIGYCKYHGGNTPTGKKNAARLYGQALVETKKRELDQLRDHLASSDRFGGNRLLTDITPEEALLEEVRRSVAMVRWLEERIGQWNFRADHTPDPNSPASTQHPDFQPDSRVLADQKHSPLPSDEFPTPSIPTPDANLAAHAYNRDRKWDDRSSSSSSSSGSASSSSSSMSSSTTPSSPSDPLISPNEFDETAATNALPKHRGLTRPGIEALGGLPALMGETSKGAMTYTDEREWLMLYRAEREHAVRVAKMAIDAGIAQRMVSIAEDQGRMLAIAIRQVLDSLNLNPQQIQLVPKVVPGILRAVTAGTPMPTLPSMSNPTASSEYD